MQKEVEVFIELTVIFEEDGVVVPVGYTKSDVLLTHQICTNKISISILSAL
ncbi:hypothetical protein ACFFH4_03885 [Halalkalibacter alkalisediminis]|uniref:Uncharacterized protein n=1 Tax=Halalkalibacter alkalisediminis TaxID=935616 RepID=A0ABV6ND72_9BACI